ncbi:UPF0236 family transposase-like protein [Virgibacillus proomii]|uniref:UPF0236 family transposase-like protein n=1 Tax=Virgibacillus proomii TaxID=84407 RepID=UPI001C0F4E92|nr:UPF0236 family protein [Virgibacillus proomii]
MTDGVSNYAFLFVGGDRFVLERYRDFERFENREMQECTIATMFDSLKVKRRIYLDRKTKKCVAFLDCYLQFRGGDTLSLFFKGMLLHGR